MTVITAAEGQSVDGEKDSGAHVSMTTLGLN